MRMVRWKDRIPGIVSLFIETMLHALLRTVIAAYSNKFANLIGFKSLRTKLPRI